MSITPEQILSMLAERREERGPALARMAEIRTAYNGDLVLPLPELDANEKQMVANLVQTGIDQTAMRIASVIPGLWYPPSRAGSKSANRRAQKCRDVNLGWWDTNKVPLKMRRRARWLLGYGNAPVTVRAGGDREPEWRLVNPLACFPAPCLDPDDVLPPDAINVYVRGRAWCERAYPEQMRSLRKGEHTKFEIVEYVGCDEIVTIVCGAPKEPDNIYGNQARIDGGADFVEILRYPNRAQRPITVVPQRITLDKLLGQYDGAIGMMFTKSMLMALSIQAQKRAIFPESWAVSGSGQGTPEIVQDAEPMSGQVGIISNGSLTYLKPEQSVFTANTMNQLEYEMRQDSSTPSQFGGYNPTNVRTGRASAQLQEAVIDFPIQEAQAVFEVSLEEENKIAIATAKAYGHKPVSMYVKGRGEVTYDPKSTFESDVHEVRYALQGADARGVEIAVGQKIGMGTLSKRTAMENDPFVRDVESELDRIRVQEIESAFMQSQQTLASQPQGPWQPRDWARWASLVATDKLEPWEATQKVDDEVKERQAKEAADQVQGPEAMPGLATPGQPGAPISPIAPPEPGMSALASRLAKLRLPTMTVPGERAGV